MLDQLLNRRRDVGRGGIGDRSCRRRGSLLRLDGRFLLGDVGRGRSSDRNARKHHGYGQNHGVGPPRPALVEARIGDHLKSPFDGAARPEPGAQHGQQRPFALDELERLKQSFCITAARGGRTSDRQRVAAQLLGNVHLSPRPPYHRMPPEQRRHRKAKCVGPVVAANVMRQLVTDDARELLVAQPIDQRPRQNHNRPTQSGPKQRRHPCVHHPNLRNHSGADPRGRVPGDPFQTLVAQIGTSQQTRHSEHLDRVPPQQHQRPANRYPHKQDRPR